MAYTYKQCKSCGVPKSQVRISKRGLCGKCAIERCMDAVSASLIAIQDAEYALHSQEGSGDKDAP